MTNIVTPLRKYRQARTHWPAPSNGPLCGQPNVYKYAGTKAKVTCRRCRNRLEAQP